MKAQRIDARSRPLVLLKTPDDQAHPVLPIYHLVMTLQVLAMEDFVLIFNVPVSGKFNGLLAKDGNLPISGTVHH